MSHAKHVAPGGMPCNTMLVHVVDTFGREGGNLNGPGDSILKEQIDYYRARADEYDEWFLRQGRYDRGPELNQLWFSEAKELEQAVESFAPAGRALELACGTGLWTRHLARFAEGVTAVDASREVLAINKARVNSDKVCYVEADIFDWRPEARYDVVFFGFWLSHVPPERFGPFWEMVGSCLAPGGRVFFIDSRYSDTSSAVDHKLSGPEATTTLRNLNDGRSFRIVKVFYRPDELKERLQGLGWRMTVHTTANYFIYGYGEAWAADAKAGSSPKVE